MIVTQGQTAVFNASAGGSEPLSYQWRFGLVDLPDATNTSLTLTNVSALQAGSYDLIVTNGEGSVTSQVATLTVLVDTDLAVEQHHYDNPVPVGGDLTYSILVTNLGPGAAMAVRLTNTLPSAVTWQSALASQGTCGLTNGLVLCSLGTIPAQSSATIAITVRPTAEGLLTNSVAVAGANNDPNLANNSSVLQGQALNPPEIVTQPGSASVLEGAMHEFSVVVTGSVPLAYQWSKGGTTISDATNATLLLTGITTDQAGDYTVVITNSVGSVTSQVATLTVVVDADLAVAQHQYNGNGPAAVGRDLTYSMLVTNLGPAAAMAVRLTNTLPSSVTWQSSLPSQGACELTNGQVICSLGTILAQSSATIAITVRPTAAGLLTNMVAVAGANNDPNPANNFSVLQGQALNPPEIVTPPVNASVFEGATHEFSIVVTGSVPLAYQWSKGGTTISDATNATLLLTGITTDQAGDYTVVITNSVGSVTSQVATLTVVVDADLAVAQHQYNGNGPAAVGRDLTCSMLVTNLGPAAAMAVRLTNTLPSSVTWQSSLPSQGACELTNGQVICSLGTILAQSSATIAITVRPTAAGPLTNVVAVAGANNDPDPTNNFSVALGEALMAPGIVTQPANRSVLEGTTHEFAVGASGSAPLAYQWRKGGATIPDATNATLLLTGITTNSAGDFAVVITNAVGSVTSQVARLTVRRLTDPVYPAPQGGWVYRYTGDAASNSQSASLDGTWVRPSTLDSWAGDGRGAGNGLIGGISISNGVMTMEDAQTSGSGFNNRRFYFTHDLLQDTAVTNASTLLNDGVTMTFRARLTPPTDPWIELANAPNGWVNNSDGKGMFGLRQGGAGGMMLGFSLNNAIEDTGTSSTFNFGLAGLHLNNLNGDSSGSFVDPGEGGTQSLLPLDPTVFHEFWVTVQNNGGAPGTHAVTIYLDGAMTPTTFNVTAGNGGPEISTTTNYLALGLGSAVQRGAVDLDFLGYRPGAHTPSGFNQPPGVVAQPQSQFVAIGGQATFTVGVTGTAPFSVQWYRDGAMVPGATNFSHTTPPVGTNDQFAAYTAVVANDYGTTTSAPPALVLLLAPPLIVSQPVSATVTNGDTAVFGISVNSATPPTFQWRFNGSPISEGTNTTLTFAAAGPGQAGAYDAIIQNSSGAVTSSVAMLTVRVQDFGDAPAGYATLKAQNGARHLLVSGVFLGASIEAEIDGLPSLAANGDDLAGSDDEDGVRFVTAPAAGQLTTVEVVASTNGQLSAWLDLNLDGDWTGAGEQVLTNAIMIPGTNTLQFVVPVTATLGNSYARFRFSTDGNLAFDGPAANGEVEDYLVVIGGAADLAIHAVLAPAAAATNAPLSYSITVTNLGPGSGGNVTLSNILPAAVTFVSALPSQGSCAQNGGVVVCDLGLLPAHGEANVVLTVQPTDIGTLTNRVSLSALQFDPVPGNNAVTVITTVAVPPSITGQPGAQTTTNGMNAAMTVTATGTSPLAYQWRRDGTPIPGGTNATLTLTNVSAADAGSYTVLVTNMAGSVLSASANLTVLIPPQILVPPANQTNLAGSTAVFQVQAGGTAPFEYQWYFQETTALAGQTSATLTLPSVQSSNAGAYRVVVSNMVGVATSAPASLVVIPMDLGDALGAGYHTLLVDDGARHVAVAGIRLGALLDFEGDGQPSATALGDDGAGIDDEDGVLLPASLLSGRTNSVSIIASTNGYLQGWIDYDRDGNWTTAGEQVFTNRAVVTGTNVFVINVPASALGGVTAARFRFSTATNLTFQGPASDGEVEDYAVTVVAEADLAVVSVTAANPVAVGGSLVYGITVTNFGPAVATGLFVTNTLPPGVEFAGSVTTQGSCSAAGSTVVCQIGTVAPNGNARMNLSVIPTAAGNLTNVTRVTAATTDSSAVNNVLTNVVTALDAPAIVAGPQNQTVTNGGLAQFTVTATGSQLQYQWRLASTNLPGATNAVLNLTNVQVANAGSYTVLVSNTVGTAVSGVATLTVLVPLAITAQPVNQSVARGGTLTLNVGVSGSGPISYQWEFEGNDVPEGNLSPFVQTNIQPSRAGTYRVRITNPVGTVISSNAVVTVLEPPIFTAHPQSTTNIVGSTAALSAAATGTPPITYQWYFNQTTILAGQTNTTLNLTNLQLSQSGNYTVVAANGSGSTTSQVAIVLVIELDFGDAPESLGYPTTMIFNGARHRILPGVRLGSLIDGESDGQPTVGATGDNLAGTADEDGISFNAPLLRGFSSPIQVVASTNGFIEAWVDFNGNGTWVDPGEKALVSEPVVAGTNVVMLPIDGIANLGATYARFRFSTAGGLASTGMAADGEVEDYAVSIQQATDLAVTMTDSPDPVVVLANLVYTMIVTNNGPSAASGVILTNILPANVTFVSVSTSVGSCSQTSGVVGCTLGNFANAAAATVNVTVRPNAAGTIRNSVAIFTTTAEGAIANNTVSQLTTVFTPPAAFSNTGAIPVADAGASGPGKGNPYPSTIVVSGLTGVVHKVTVTLLNLTHTFADDLDVLLVGPGGETVFLLSDVGGDTALSAVNLTLDDDADVVLPNTGTITSTAYRPTTYEPISDFFPAPAPGPAGLYGTTLSVLRGSNPNGTWSLYVVDDLEGDLGTVGGGWRLNVTTSDPMSNLAAELVGPAGTTALGSNLVFTAYATNRGPAAAAQVRLTNALPANASFVAATPSQGGCQFSNGVVDCALGALAPNAVASVQLTYQPLAAGTITNSVGIWADEVDLVPTNNRATATALVRLATDLAVLQTTGTNLVILSNDVVYSLLVTNRGPRAASGVSLTDLLPTGVSFISAVSTKGSCQQSGLQVDCSIGSLALGEGAVATVRVRPNSVGNYTNIVTCALNEFDPVADNNRATNVVTAAILADIAVSLTGAPNPVVLSNRMTFVANVTNRGPSAASAVVLTNMLPPGTAYLDSTASAGSCSAADGMIVCTLGSMASGSNVVVSLGIRADVPGSVSNVVSVGSLALDETLSNNVASAIISVEQPPFVVTPPAAVTTTNGGSAAFQVTAGGTAPLLFQWRREGVDVANATNSTLNLSNVAYGARGNYAVLISNRVGSVTSTVAALTVLVPPTISDVPPLTLNEDESSLELPLVVQDLDHAPEQLSIIVSSSNQTLIPATNVIVSGTSSNRTVRVTPATNQAGTATVTLTVRDPDNLTAVDTFDVTVLPINDPPLMTAIGNRVMTEDGTLSIDIGVMDVDDETTNIVLEARCLNSTVIPDSGLTLSGDGTNRVLMVTPATNQSGIVVIAVTARDAAGGTNVQTFEVNIEPVNDAPTLGALSSLVVLENSGARVVPFGGVSTGATNESDALIVSASSSDPTIIPHPTITYVSPQASGSLSVTLAPDRAGSVTITVTVDDGGATNRLTTREMTIRVLAASERPVIRGITPVAGGVEVTFPTTVGLQYVLERTDDLSGGNWVAIPPLAGTGNDVVVPDSPLEGSRFYRLRVQAE